MPPPPPKPPPARLGTRFVDHQRAAVHLELVEFVDGLLRAFVGGHLDEREAARPAGRLIAHHVHVGHVTGAAEQFVQSPRRSRCRASCPRKVYGPSLTRSIRAAVDPARRARHARTSPRPPHQQDRGNDRFADRHKRALQGLKSAKYSRPVSRVGARAGPVPAWYSPADAGRGGLDHRGAAGRVPRRAGAVGRPLSPLRTAPGRAARHRRAAGQARRHPRLHGRHDHAVPGGGPDDDPRPPARRSRSPPRWWSNPIAATSKPCRSTGRRAARRCRAAAARRRGPAHPGTRRRGARHRARRTIAATPCRCRRGAGRRWP